MSLASATIHPECHPVARLAGAGGWRLSLLHSRPTPVMLWLSRAQGHAIIGGLRHGLGPATVLFLPPGTLFSLDTGPQIFGTAVIWPEASDIALPASPQRLRIARLQAQSELTQSLDAMQREQDADHPLREAAADAHARLVAIWLRRAVLDADPPARPRNGDQRLAVRFFAQIAAQGAAQGTAQGTAQGAAQGAALAERARGANVADHARQLGVSAPHLSRACLAATGKPASTLLAEHRLHQARTLLADSGHPVGRIATYLGFRSAAHFSRFVATHTGKSPTELRKTAQHRLQTRS